MITAEHGIVFASFMKISSTALRNHTVSLKAGDLNCDSHSRLKIGQHDVSQILRASESQRKDFIDHEVNGNSSVPPT